MCLFSFSSTESPTCEQSQSAYIRLIGTCIPLFGAFPSLVFGDGNYPTGKVTFIYSAKIKGSSILGQNKYINLNLFSIVVYNIMWKYLFVLL